MELIPLYRDLNTGIDTLKKTTSVPLCGYSHTQQTASDEWVLNHNNDSTILAVQIYVNRILVEPDEIILDTGSTVRIRFATPTVGEANLLVLNANFGCGVL